MALTAAGFPFSVSFTDSCSEAEGGNQLAVTTDDYASYCWLRWNGSAHVFWTGGGGSTVGSTEIDSLDYCDLTDKDWIYVFYDGGVKISLNGVVIFDIVNSAMHTSDGVYNQYPAGATLTQGDLTEASDKDYSHGDNDSLPAADADLEHEFSSADYTAVATDDGSYVNEPYTQLYGSFLFKDQNTNSTDGISVEWNGKSSLAPSSKVVTLQVYDRVETTWEDVDTDNTTGANTDFTLTGTLLSDLDHYYDANHWVAFRVVQ